MGSQSEHDSIFGEEDEDVIFDEYARIKKYDGNGEKGSKSWGHVKLFKHKKLGNVRVCMTEELFRRPSIFATHPISSEMGLWSRDDGYLYWDTNQYYFCSRFSSDEATEKFARMFRESVESEKRKKYDASIQLERQGKLFERIITGEEVEDVLLQMKSKLYEFERKVNQWKELCVGTIKLLKHKLTGKVRLVMRSKSLNIYANHRISSGMLVDVYASNYTSCVWAATDFYKGHSKEKLFGIHLTLRICVKYKSLCLSIQNTPEGHWARICAVVMIYFVTLIALFRSMTCNLTKRLPCSLPNDDNSISNLTSDNSAKDEFTSPSPIPGVIKADLICSL